MKVMFVGKPFEKLRDTIDPAFSDHIVRIVDDGDLAEEVGWAEAVILRPMEFGENYLSKADNLRLVQRWGVGYEGLDVDACSRHGVYACNVPSRGTGNAESVAETAIMHMLLLSRRFSRSQEKMREGKIFTPPGRALWKKRACVVGLGDLGHCVAERLFCLGMEVVGVNRTLREEFENWGIKQVFPLTEMEKAFENSDYVILCLPLNESTLGIIGENELRFMEKRAFLVNVARGGLVQREALEHALKEEWIAGAGLDVLWEEPHDPDDPFLNNRKVTITPHIGGVTDASVSGIRDFIAENVDRISRGQKPSSCLNPEL